LSKSIKLHCIISKLSFSRIDKRKNCMLRNAFTVFHYNYIIQMQKYYSVSSLSCQFELLTKKNLFLFSSLCCLLINNPRITKCIYFMDKQFYCLEKSTEEPRHICFTGHVSNISLVDVKQIWLCLSKQKLIRWFFLVKNC
jgi:hypothetical protein